MTPFYFGDRLRRLFGIYHAGSDTGGPLRALVLCSPWGPDYIHSHRTVRQAAIQLAAAGFHVLRFDYFGTGDSAGELTEASIAMWEDDIRSAMREVAEMSGATRVGLVGLRFGAILAGRVAAADPKKIDRLILWDPIVNGTAYLEELFSDSHLESQRFREPRTRPANTGGGHELQGFALTDIMAREIRELDIRIVGAGLPQRCYVLMTGPVNEMEQVRQRLVPPLDPALIERIAAVPIWIDIWPIVRSTPMALLRRLVERTKELN